MASTSGASSSAGTSGQNDSKADRLQKLRELRLKMNEARKMNHQEVQEEDRRAKLPKNWEARKRQVDWEEEQETKKQACAEAGEDFDRVKLLEVNAEDAEKWERLKKKKKNPDQGFSDYEQASFRQYQRLTKQLKPSMDEYEREKDKMGEAFYAEKDTLGVLEHKDSDAAIDRMVTDLNKQVEKRGKYSRRRAHDDDGDISYINERNMKFNQKLERFYGTYTAEIKQNLERGTAV